MDYEPSTKYFRAEEDHVRAMTGQSWFDVGLHPNAMGGCCVASSIII